MATIQLNEDTVEAHYELMTKPQDYDLPFRPFEDCFEWTEAVMAQHVLFDAYRSAECPGCPKIFFYIVLEKVYGPAHGKDAEGFLGYKLRFTPKPDDDSSASTATTATEDHDVIHCKKCSRITAVVEGGRCQICGELVCLVCGCTETRACRGGCSWARAGVCSGCDVETSTATVADEF